MSKLILICTAVVLGSLSFFSVVVADPLPLRPQFQGEAVADPKFEDYRVPLYEGEIKVPSWMVKREDGKKAWGSEWMNEIGKSVPPAYINFAGKYFITVQSVGMGSSFYSVDNLSGDGAASPDLSSFDTREPFRYIGKDGLETRISYSADSSMLVAIDRFAMPDTDEKNDWCQSQVFVFENGQINAITDVQEGC